MQQKINNYNNFHKGRSIGFIICFEQVFFVIISAI